MAKILTMDKRNLIGHRKVAEPVVGKRSRLHSLREGAVTVKDKKEGYPERLTHDCQNVLGWNRRG